MSLRVINKIMCYEWDMLLAVNAGDARLECKNNKPMFFLMRSSQWDVYPETIQIAYLNDIHAAVNTGRNLMVEKYGYMMAETDPAGFERIKHALPPITDEKRALVEKIAADHKVWYEEAKAILPGTIGMGRTDNPANPQLASVQNYLRGELYTYSINTLQKIIAYNDECRKQGKNLVVEIHKRYVR